MVAFPGLDGQDRLAGAILPVGLYHMLIDMNDSLHTKNVHFMQKMYSCDWKKVFPALLFNNLYTLTAAMATEKDLLKKLNNAVTTALVDRVLDDPGEYIDSLPERERSELFKRKITQAKVSDERVDHQTVELHKALSRLPDVPDLRKEIGAMRALIIRQENQLILAQKETEMWRHRAQGEKSADGFLQYINHFCRYAEDYFNGLRDHFVTHEYVKSVCDRLTDRGIVSAKES